MDEKKFEQLAEVYQALADPNRLKLLDLLRRNPYALCVNALANKLNISQSAVSQHLKILRLPGLVTVKKEGYFKHYSISKENFDTFRSLREVILGKDFQL